METRSHQIGSKNKIDRNVIAIVPFATEFREHFYRLNAAWLEKYFHIEAIDQRVLSDPENEIIAKGGQILFATFAETVVGTCALMSEKPGEFELSKMAVDEQYQGLGIGRLLINSAIFEFKKNAGTLLFLETNSVLQPAITLYESSGFQRQEKPKPDSHYGRANVYMIWRGV